jgi:hypothetical protein
MKNIFIISILLFAGKNSFSQEAPAPSASGKKMDVGVTLGYGLPMGGDFGKYYSGALLYDLSLGYKINSGFGVSVGGEYGKFALKNTSSYIADKQDQIVADQYAPPYTELVGGGIRVIAVHAEAKKIFMPEAKTKFSVMAGPSLSFLEKSPVDGTDSTGTYQILRHYVHEKPFGVNVGGGIEHEFSQSFSVMLAVRYKMLLTSQVQDKMMGIVAIQLGCAVKF